MSIRDQVIEFYTNYPKSDVFDPSLQLHNPFDAPSRRVLIEEFYLKFYNDGNPRVHLLGINPSRLTTTSTGVHYTDGYALQEICGIENEFTKSRELTSEFFYEVVQSYEDAGAFFGRIFAWAALPIAITQDNTYVNYYETKDEMIKELVSKNVEWLQNVPRTGRLVVLGIGQNKKYIENMAGYPFGYNEVSFLPHPRWIMQYNRNKLGLYIEAYRHAIG